MAYLRCLKLTLPDWLSARCVYSQYIVCIGLSKHCKRIHSTEPYFQKVVLCILFIIFPPSPPTVAAAYQYVSAGSWSLLFLLFVFRKHGRPCVTTWLDIDKRRTNVVAAQTHPCLTTRATSTSHFATVISPPKYSAFNDCVESASKLLSEANFSKILCF